MRPRYHITATTNWLNDPNGPLLWNGRYHLFFQANPAAPRWDRPQWGHVSSDDLVTWTHHPPALVPDDAGPDRDGCWSGCARTVEGVPTIYYTGVAGLTDADRVESVCRATSWGPLDHWQKDAGPLVEGPRPAGVHRDPFVVSTPDGPILLLGSSIDGPGGRAGAVIAYHAGAPEIWDYQGVWFAPAAGSLPIDTGPIWECPQLIDVGGRDVLVVSVNDPKAVRPLRYAVAFSGVSTRERFTASAVEKVDYGDVFYAPATLTEPDGRVLMWGWLQETGPIGPGPDTWAGALSLPRRVTADRSGLVVRPAPELAGLRRATLWQGRITADGEGTPVPMRPSSWFELAGTAGAEGATTHLSLTADGAPRLTLTLHRQTAELLVEGRRFSLPCNGPSPMPVRLFVDADIVEVFLAERFAVSTRLDRGIGPLGVWFRAEGDGTAAVEGAVYACA